MIFTISTIVGLALGVLCLALLIRAYVKDKGIVLPMLLFAASMVLVAGSLFCHVRGGLDIGPLHIPAGGSQEQDPSADLQPPTPLHSGDEPDISPEEPEEGPQAILLGDTSVTFDLHTVTSGIGDNELFQIAVAHTEKSALEGVTSEELSAFIKAINYTGTNGNAVLMFEDGTGLSMMEVSCAYTADYGYIDVSEGQFTMTERLGAIWNEARGGWSYKTAAEMRGEDEAPSATTAEPVSATAVPAEKRTPSSTDPAKSTPVTPPSSAQDSPAAPAVPEVPPERLTQQASESLGTGPQLPLDGSGDSASAILNATGPAVPETPRLPVSSAPSASATGEGPQLPSDNGASGDKEQNSGNGNGQPGSTPPASDESQPVYAHNFSGGRVLITTASDNNSDPVYHTTDCTAAQKISAEDAAWFESEDAAKANGRRLCGFCARKQG